MGIVIKKFGKKTIFSLFSLGVFILALASRLIFGGNHVNLSKLGEKTGDVFGKESSVISSARADTPPPPISGGSEGAGCGESGSEGCGCGEGGY